MQQIKGGDKEDTSDANAVHQKNKISKTTSFDSHKSSLNKSNEKYGTMNFNKIPFPNIGGTISGKSNNICFFFLFLCQKNNGHHDAH